MREKRLSRHWQILLTLDAMRQGSTINELADLVGYNIRTVYRDIDALMDAGFPIISEKTPDGTKYRFMEDYRLRMKLSFSPMELIALQLATETFNILEGTVFHDALEDVKKKVEATLTEKHREYSDTIRSAFQVSFRPVRDYSKFRDVIEGVTRSLIEKQSMKIRYWSVGSGKETTREIESYRLWYVNGVFYLVAYCKLRKSVRTFMIDRIRDWELTDSHYKIPESFDFEKYASSGFKVLGGTKEREVVVRVHPILKAQMTEQTWHPTQKVEELKDGWLRVSFRLGALDEVKTWVQGYAPYIVVEKPKELISEIVESFNAALKAYSSKKILKK